MVLWMLWVYRYAFVQSIISHPCMWDGGENPVHEHFNQENDANQTPASLSKKMSHVHMGQHMIWNENGKHVFLGSWILSRMVSEKHMPAQQKGHFMDFDSKIRSWRTKRPNTCTARIFFKPPLRPRINIFPIEQTWVVEPKQREFTRVFSWQLNKKPLETLSQRSAFLVAFVPHTVIYECGCSRILSSMSRIWALMAGSPNQWKLIFCQPRGLFLGPR